MQAGLRAAAFEADVTPKIGDPVAYVPARSIEDPLSARGLVLLGSGKPVVICAVDFIGIAGSGHDYWKNELARAAGTTPDRVTVHTLHQHDAPRMDPGASQLLTKADLGGRSFNDEFGRAVVARTADALRAAVLRAQPVTHIGVGEAEVEKVASNRRILGPDGKVKYGRMSASRIPEAIAAPEGTIDPMMKLISFWNGEKAIASLTYYATHPQSYYGKGDVTAEFVGLARGVRDRELPGIANIHFNGASGNVAAGKYNDGSPAMRPVLRDRMAAAMRKAWDRQTKAAVPAAIEWRTVNVRLPLADHLVRGPLEAKLADGSAPYTDRLNAATAIALLDRSKNGYPVQLSCLRLGGVYVLFMPGELFVEYQLAAQKMRPAGTIAMAAYGDYAPGYIGTDIAYSQGGYEVSERASRVKPGVEPVLMDGMRKLLKQAARAVLLLGAEPGTHQAQRRRHFAARQFGRGENLQRPAIELNRLPRCALYARNVAVEPVIGLGEIADRFEILRGGMRTMLAHDLLESFDCQRRSRFRNPTVSGLCLDDDRNQDRNRIGVADFAERTDDEHEQPLVSRDRRGFPAGSGTGSVNFGRRPVKQVDHRLHGFEHSVLHQEVEHDPEIVPVAEGLAQRRSRIHLSEQTEDSRDGAGIIAPRQYDGGTVADRGIGVGEQIGQRGKRRRCDDFDGSLDRMVSAALRRGQLPHRTYQTLCDPFFFPAAMSKAFSGAQGVLHGPLFGERRRVERRVEERGIEDRGIFEVTIEALRQPVRGHCRDRALADGARLRGESQVVDVALRAGFLEDEESVDSRVTLRVHQRAAGRCLGDRVKVFFGVEPRDQILGEQSHSRAIVSEPTVQGGRDGQAILVQVVGEIDQRLDARDRDFPVEVRFEISEDLPCSGGAHGSQRLNGCLLAGTVPGMYAAIEPP